MSEDVLNTAQLQEALDKSPSQLRVTPEMLDSRIASVGYQVLAGTSVTICNLTLDNGFSVRGESACVDPANFNRDVGQTIAYNNAKNKLWQLFGFLLAELRYRSMTQDEEALIVAGAAGEQGGE